MKIRRASYSFRHKAALGHGGFTLVEVLIVIVILAVLAGISIFAIGSFGGSGTVEACKNDVKTVETAAQAYHADNSSYPSSVGDLAAYLKQPPPQADTDPYKIEIVTSPSEAVIGTINATSTAC